MNDFVEPVEDEVDISFSAPKCDVARVFSLRESLEPIGWRLSFDRGGIRVVGNRLFLSQAYSKIRRWTGVDLRARKRAGGRSDVDA